MRFFFRIINILFKKINSLENLVVSVDIPSGMICHGITEGEVIRADEVLSFEFVKLAFLLPENKFRIKNWNMTFTMTLLQR